MIPQRIEAPHSAAKPINGSPASLPLIHTPSHSNLATNHLHFVNRPRSTGPSGSSRYCVSVSVAMSTSWWYQSRDASPSTVVLKQKKRFFPLCSFFSESLKVFVALELNAVKIYRKLTGSQRERENEKKEGWKDENRRFALKGDTRAAYTLCLRRSTMPLVFYKVLRLVYEIIDWANCLVSAEEERKTRK